MDLIDYPKISIVTPVFNQVMYLEETILSILNQNYPNLEYIIIDGGSTDGTVDIIKKYEQRLAYWVSEPDRGMYDAIQKGFDKSTGEIMGWLNADDLLYQRSLFAVALTFLQHPEANWITSHHTMIDEKGTVIYNGPSIPYCKLHFYLPSKPWHNYGIGQESTFWRRSLWERAGSYIDTSLKLAGDYELWIRFFQYDQLFIVNSLFGMFRSRKGQLSSDIESYWREADEVMHKFPLSEKEEKIIENYIRKQKTTRIINRFKIINGRVISRLSKLEGLYFRTPQNIGYDSE